MCDLLENIIQMLIEMADNSLASTSQRTCYQDDLRELKEDL